MFQSSIAISLPGSILQALEISSSVFSLAQSDLARLPPDLQRAIELIAESATQDLSDVRFIARPEIFTHGDMLVKLRRMLGGAEDHVALTDGLTFRPIPGFRNHLFFYSRGRPECIVALSTLAKVAPDVLLSATSQINGNLKIRVADRWHSPDTMCLRLEKLPSLTHSEFSVFYCNHSSAHDSAARICRMPQVNLEAIDANCPVTYVLLSRAALADRAFCSHLASRILKTAFSDAELLLLGLDDFSSGSATKLDSIRAVMEAVSGTGKIFPRVPIPSVLFAAALPPARMLQSGSILLHPATEFWRLPFQIYRDAQAVELFEPEFAPQATIKLYRAWLRRDYTYIRRGGLSDMQEGVTVQWA
jgi:hypothetical protein